MRAKLTVLYYHSFLFSTLRLRLRKCDGILPSQYIHLKLSALEPEGHGNESAEVINEILTGKPSHTETTTEEDEGLNHNENIETPHTE